MKTAILPAKNPEFQKTDVTCLYRYTSNGVYYALAKHQGKQKRSSLKTTGKAVAKRLLADFQMDLGKADTSQGRITLRELCTRHLAAIASQATEAVNSKTAIVRRLLADFVPGADVQAGKVRPSDLQGWISSYDFGYASLQPLRTGD